MRLTAIAGEINRRAKGRQIGNLQELRKELKHKKRLPHRAIFHLSSIFEAEDYAFNYGWPNGAATSPSPLGAP